MIHSVYEIGQALENSHNERLPNVIAIECCKKEKYPETIRIYVKIPGTLKPDEIASKVLAALEDIKKESQKKSRQVLNVEVSDLTPNAILRKVTEVLMRHFKVDEKMKQLHANMARNVAENMKEEAPSSSGACSDSKVCTCTEGNLWIEEIKKEEYWVPDPPSKPKPTPYKNQEIQKPKQAGQHYTDVHQLFESQSSGYLKLSGVFLEKKLKPDKPIDEYQNISEYLDSNGIFELLRRCAAFLPITEKKLESKRDALKKLIGVRAEISHLPASISSASYEESIIQTVTEALPHLLPFDTHRKLLNDIAKIKDGKIQLSTATDKPNSQNTTISKEFDRLNISNSACGENVDDKEDLDQDAEGSASDV